ncbi:hypothetical protein CRUP_026301 [Coryphaenoides rupestris]|nr:hypothetical protein CRUP_026301 [Coryphaenoides rupestris]
MQQLRAVSELLHHPVGLQTTGDHNSRYLFIKVHEEHDLVLDGGEEVVFVDQLVHVFVAQPQRWSYAYLPRGDHNNHRGTQILKEQTLMDIPQPTMRVWLSFQQRLQGYMSGRRVTSSRRTLSRYLFIKVHEEHDLVLDGGEEVVFVDQLVHVFVAQPQRWSYAYLPRGDHNNHRGTQILKEQRVTSWSARGARPLMKNSVSNADTVVRSRAEAQETEGEGERLIESGVVAAWGSEGEKRCLSSPPVKTHASFLRPRILSAARRMMSVIDGVRPPSTHSELRTSGF